jgi:hypothetical protein
MQSSVSGIPLIQSFPSLPVLLRLPQASRQASHTPVLPDAASGRGLEGRKYHLTWPGPWPRPKREQGCNRHTTYVACKPTRLPQELGEPICGSLAFVLRFSFPLPDHDASCCRRVLFRQGVQRDLHAEPPGPLGSRKLEASSKLDNIRFQSWHPLD